MILITSCEKDQDVISSHLIIQNENISSFYKCAIIESELNSRATLSNVFVEYSILNKNDYQKIEIKKIADKYYAVITNLFPNSSYNYQYIASNRFTSKTVETSSIFTTLPNTSIPAVLTDTAYNITKSSAILQGYVIDDGGENITEFGFVYATSSFPTINDQKVSLTNANWNLTITLTDLNAETNYYVRTYAINNKGISYGNQITFTTLEHAENGHKYVDLGLSVKWASHNIGASSPEDYGDYFAWGETRPKKNYTWKTYIYGDEYGNGTMTKYCNNYMFGYLGYFTDDKTTLESSDDAAHINWGGKWRMPTDAELTELKTKCTWIFMTRNNVCGYEVTACNGNSIFLPAAGCIMERDFSGKGTVGYYWSKSLCLDYYSNAAWHIYFTQKNIKVEYGARFGGATVRPVCP